MSLSELTGHEDPHPTYERMRARGPLVRDDGIWVTTSHRTANSILRDRRFGVRYTDGTYPGATGIISESFLGTDPPDHTRLRRLAAPAFSPKRIDSYRPRVEKIADALLERDDLDLVEDFAAPLPIAVISDLLGIPDEDTVEFAEYGTLVAESFDRGISPELVRAGEKLMTLFDRLIRERRKRPGDDVISSLVAAEDERKLTAHEVVGTLNLLLVAGFETTVNLISSGAWLLLEHPAQWRLFQAHPQLAPDVVEEVLRYAPPVHLTSRIAHERVGPIGVDEEVTILIGAANRDPDVYPEPHRFDVMRVRQPEHLAFSSGIHYCLGATLARMEGEVAFRALARRMPDLRQTGPATVRDSVVFRGLASFPVSRS